MMFFALLVASVQSQAQQVCNLDWCCDDDVTACNVASATQVDASGNPDAAGAYCKCDCKVGYLSYAQSTDPLYLDVGCEYCGGHNNVTGYVINPLNGDRKTLPQPEDTYFNAGGSECVCDAPWTGSIYCSTCPSPLAGAACDQCEKEYDQSSYPHCDVCADGYFMDPRPPTFMNPDASPCKLAKECTTDYCTSEDRGQGGLWMNSNNVKSAAVDPHTKTCECTCTEGWFGKMQLSGTDSSNGWAACQYCQGQGKSYSGTSYMDGTCVCTGQWTSSQPDGSVGGPWGCGDCPFEFGPDSLSSSFEESIDSSGYGFESAESEYGQTCNQCASGWTKGGYPTCDMSNDNPINKVAHGIEAWLILAIAAAILVPCCLIILCCGWYTRLIAICCFFMIKKEEDKLQYGLLGNQ